VVFENRDGSGNDNKLDHKGIGEEGEKNKSGNLGGEQKGREEDELRGEGRLQKTALYYLPYDNNRS